MVLDVAVDNCVTPVLNLMREELRWRQKWLAQLEEQRRDVAKDGYYSQWSGKGGKPWKFDDGEPKWEFDPKHKAGDIEDLTPLVEMTNLLLSTSEAFGLCIDDWKTPEYRTPLAKQEHARYLREQVKRLMRAATGKTYAVFARLKRKEPGTIRTTRTRVFSFIKQG